MRRLALVAALGAAGFGVAGCDSSGTADAGNNAADAVPEGSAGVQASGNISVNLPDRVEVEGVTVGLDGATVSVGDTNASVKTGRDPSISVTTNRQ